MAIPPYAPYCSDSNAATAGDRVRDIDDCTCDNPARTSTLGYFDWSAAFSRT